MKKKYTYAERRAYWIGVGAAKAYKNRKLDDILHNEDSCLRESGRNGYVDEMRNLVGKKKTPTRR